MAFSGIRVDDRLVLEIVPKVKNPTPEQLRRKERSAAAVRELGLPVLESLDQAGDGLRLVTGGGEGLIHEAAVAGFARMLALSTAYDDQPERASRPFDKDRDGFVLSEGAGIMILERLDQALQRGAHIYAEVLGHSSSSDAFHVAAPDPQAVEIFGQFVDIHQLLRCIHSL